MLLLAPLATGFGFDDVAQSAAQRCRDPYKARNDKLPEALAELDYDQYRDIRFKPDHSLWRARRLPFEVAFFHPGLYFKDPVKINEVVGDVVREVRFDPELFDYGDNAIDRQGDARASGSPASASTTRSTRRSTRTRCWCSSARAISARSARASVRAVGARPGGRYGARRRARSFRASSSSGSSARHPMRRELTIYALLDSRRVTGAYRFVREAREPTPLMDVKARLFLRENVSKLGIAPLTSMYFFGENQRARHATTSGPKSTTPTACRSQSGTGEWIWRPLVNPKRLLVTSFALTNPAGFG